MSTVAPNALEGLHSASHSELLDAVDELRAQGLNTLLPLPQLIVCGDQSSGKSSVLEAISGVPFPKKDNLCTRFATEVVLRRSAVEKRIQVSITPGSARSEADRKQLLDFERSVENVGDLPNLIEEAQKAMGLGSFGNAFSADILRLDVVGSRVPQLTIVDLPGLIHSENKLQTAQDVELVSKLVEDYMQQERSVILAVVSAKNDYANQIVLKRARESDRQGSRTLGIITKPDTLYPGSGGEQSFLSLARNQDVKFELGWHVVRNLDSNTDGFDYDKRERLEAEFFGHGSWKALDPSTLGIYALRNRLSEVLFAQIKKELPNLLKEIQTNIEDCETVLHKLGRSRLTEEEQRAYLFDTSENFQRVCRAGCDGYYEDKFFGDAMTSNDTRRIRAVVQNENTEFEERMRLEGARWQVGSDEINGGPPLSREQAIGRVKVLIKKSRGRELPGTFNPLWIGELFREYSEPWRGVAQKHVHLVWTRTQEFLDLVLQSIADDDVAEALRRHVIHDALQNRLSEAQAKLEVVIQESRYHPITYNHYFTDTATKMQHDRQMKGMKEKLTNSIAANQTLGKEHIDWILDQLKPSIQVDMNQAAAETTFDYMKAYYKTAMKRFVDDIAVQVLETEIVTKLTSIFEPSHVGRMDKDMVARIAGESSSKKYRRDQVKAKLTILKESEKTCQLYSLRKIADSDNFQRGPEADVQSLSSFSDIPEPLQEESKIVPKVHWQAEESDPSSERPLDLKTPLEDPAVAPVEDSWANWKPPMPTKSSKKEKKKSSRSHYVEEKSPWQFPPASPADF